MARHYPAILGRQLVWWPPRTLVSLAAEQALIDAARKEGEVSWYTTQIINQFARPAADAFQKKYSIKVIPVRGGSFELAVKLLNEHRAGRVQADVFDGTSTVAAVKRLASP